MLFAAMKPYLLQSQLCEVRVVGCVLPHQCMHCLQTVHVAKRDFLLAEERPDVTLLVAPSWQSF
jgi:hypothetical protein